LRKLLARLLLDLRGDLLIDLRLRDFLLPMAPHPGVWYIFARLYKRLPSALLPPTGEKPFIFKSLRAFLTAWFHDIHLFDFFIYLKKDSFFLFHARAIFSDLDMR
jgi:hypothetical protein